MPGGGTDTEQADGVGILAAELHIVFLSAIRRVYHAGFAE